MMVLSSNEKYGLARSMSVMPGDVVNAEVYAKYVDPNPTNWNAALTTLMNNIASGAAGVVVDGANYSTSTTTFPAQYPGLLTKTTNGAPRAYLNWLVFDRDYKFLTGGFRQVSTAAREYGQDAAHERLASPAITITQPGYVYIYVSNDNTTPVEVYFDDFKVTQAESPVVQQDDYYPFGLTFNSYTRENAVLNKHNLFQNQEHIDDLGLNWDSYRYRNHQPDIGRFFNIDPMASAFYYNSPYAFSENKVTTHREMEGLEAFFIHGTISDNTMWKKDVTDFMIRELQPYFNTNQTADTGFKWNEYGGGGRNLNWIGNSGKRERVRAARKLAGYIMKNRKKGQGITLVGHSHGGNVAIQAARILFEKHKDENGNPIRVNIVNFNTPAWNGANNPENPWDNFGIDEMLHFFTEGDNVAGPLSGEENYGGLVASNVRQIELKNPLKKDFAGYNQHLFNNVNWQEVLSLFQAINGGGGSSTGGGNKKKDADKERAKISGGGY